MHYPRVVICETGKRFGERLLVACPERRWVLRQVRDPDECLAALPVGGPAVLVVELDRPPERLALIDRVRSGRPMTAIVVVLQEADPALDRFCRELGAVHVMSSVAAFSELPEVVEALVRAQWTSYGAGDDAASRAAAIG